MKIEISGSIIKKTKQKTENKNFNRGAKAEWKLSLGPKEAYKRHNSLGTSKLKKMQYTL